PSPRQRETRDALSVVRVSWLRARHLDGLADTDIRAATADIPAHRFFYVLVRRLAIALEQCDRAHDLTALAVAALHDIVRHPRILNGAPHRVLTDRLDRDDGTVADQRDGNNARAGRDAADVYRARAAGGDAAAVLGSGQLQLVPQDPEQGRSRISGNRSFLTIDSELIRGHG